MRLLFLVTGSLLPMALAAPFAASPVAAQSQEEPEIATPQVIDRMFECRSIAEPEARLACFDREVAAVFAARESKELVIAEREQVEEAKRGLFGLKLPTIKLFGGGSDEDDLNEITTTLAGATKLDSGRHIFELEDGARWIEVEDAAGYRRFKAGDEITISRASLGSFKAKVDGKRAVQVRRIN